MKSAGPAAWLLVVVSGLAADLVASVLAGMASLNQEASAHATRARILLVIDCNGLKPPGPSRHVRPSQRTAHERIQWVLTRSAAI